MFKICLLRCVAIAMVLACAAPVQARIWTSNSGKETEADFVDADETTVTLKKSDGKEIKVKLELLIDSDQDLVRNILVRRIAKKGRAVEFEDDAPLTSETATPSTRATSPAKPANLDKPESNRSFQDFSSTGKPSKTTKQPRSALEKPTEKEKENGSKVEERKWVNNEGKAIIGKFIRMQGGVVLLLCTGKQIPAPFDKLSYQDQKYVVDLLTARGEPIHLPEGMKLPTPSPIAQNPVAAAIPLPMPVPPVPPAEIAAANAQPAAGFGSDMEGAVSVPPEILEGYNGMKLRDGTVITPHMLAELTTDQLNILRAYLSFPVPAREEMALTTLNAAQLQKQQAAAAAQNGNLNLPTQPVPSAIASTPMTTDPNSPPALSSPNHFPRRPRTPTPSNSIGSSRPNMMEIERQQKEARRVEAEERARAEQEEFQRRQQAKQQRELERQQRQLAQSSAHFTTNNQYSSPANESGETKVCGKCNRPVPSNITAGGSCPHCHVRFAYDETTGEATPDYYAAIFFNVLRGGLIALPVLFGIGRWMSNRS